MESEFYWRSIHSVSNRRSHAHSSVAKFTLADRRLNEFIKPIFPIHTPPLFQMRSLNFSLMAPTGTSDQCNHSDRPNIPLGEKCQTCTKPRSSDNQSFTFLQVRQHNIYSERATEDTLPSASPETQTLRWYRCDESSEALDASSERPLLLRRKTEGVHGLAPLCSPLLYRVYIEFTLGTELFWIPLLSSSYNWLQTLKTIQKACLLEQLLCPRLRRHLSPPLTLSEGVELCLRAKSRERSAWMAGNLGVLWG